MTNDILPEYISGIPTAKYRSAERIVLIKKYYSDLWKKLQRMGHNNVIFNDFLGVNIYIVEKESDKKTTNAASKNWQSTLAVKRIYDVVRFASCDENTPIFHTPKAGSQTKNRYKNIAVLYYDFIDNEIPYMNFKVKLTIGIRSNNKHVQYCINKIDIEKSRPYKALTN